MLNVLVAVLILLPTLVGALITYILLKKTDDLYIAFSMGMAGAIPTGFLTYLGLSHIG